MGELWLVGGTALTMDAEAGDILWAMCLTDQQTQSATYAVYNDISPAPTRPAPLAPDGTQGPLIPRSLITLIGNEGPHHFNNLGWINDGGTETIGNNVAAHTDLNALASWSVAYPPIA